VARTISDRADADAATNFEAFLPQASRNSLDLVRFLLREMARVDLSAG
jgi:nucleoside phosphorylase